MHDVALHPWRILSLCAGVGGLDLGVRLAEPEARSVCYVEREAAAASILVARMEDGWLHPAPIWSDLATFHAGAWRGAVDCVVSGDPCQPNSNSGYRLGPDDDRWLLDRVIDVVTRCRPSRVFRENVTGNADGQLGILVPALERLGYRVASGIFSAAEVGGAHDRERLFVMADAGGARLEGRERLPIDVAEIGDRASGSSLPTAECRADGGGQINPWDAEPEPDRTADDVADRVDRIHACGNGVVPLVAGYAWRTLEARLAAAGAGDAAVRVAA